MFGVVVIRAEAELFLNRIAKKTAASSALTFWAGTARRFLRDHAKNIFWGFHVVRDSVHRNVRIHDY